MEGQKRNFSTPRPRTRLACRIRARTLVEKLVSEQTNFTITERWSYIKILMRYLNLHKHVYDMRDECRDHHPDSDFDLISFIFDNVTNIEYEQMRDNNSPVRKIRISKHHIDAHIRCSICLEDLKLKQKAKILVCTHVFHAHCISTWLDLVYTCPVCRKDLIDIRIGEIINILLQ